MTNLLVEVFKAQQELMKKTVACQQPTEEQMKKLQEPTAKAITTLGRAVCFKTDPLYNHWKAVEELSKTANWVMVAKTPMDYVDNTWQVGEFYALKVHKEFKTSDPAQAEWVNGLKKVGSELLAFVKEYHKTGLSWNKKGVPVDQYSAGAAPAAPSVPAAPAAPPCPPVSESSSSSSSSSKPPPPDMSSVFGELSKGEGITSMLRKVKPEEKTKNRPPEERVGTVPMNIGEKKVEEKPAPAGVKPKAAAPPVFENRGGKLRIENQVANKTMEFASEMLQQTIYMYNCKNSILKVTGKINSIVIDKCVGCGIVLENVVSSIETINCRDIDVQITGVAASCVVESTEGVKVYVTEEGMKKLELFSSKSANVIVYAPGIRVDPDTKEEQEGLIEHALPSTLRSVFNGPTLAHEFVKHG